MRRLALYILGGGVVIAAVVVLVMLGLWQLERLTWKTDLLANIENNKQAQPVSLEDAIMLREAEQTFHPVVIEGAFVSEPIIFYGLRLHEKRAGYHIIMPFRTRLAAKNSSVLDYVILVNLGWVAQDTFPNWQPPPELASIARITGRLRLPETPNIFTPANLPDTGTWQVMNVDEINAYYGLYPSLPYWVQLTDVLVGEGWPQPITAIPQLPNNHLKYALTWFALALGLIAVVIIAVIRPRWSFLG
jgi:surfeit locus 1 family protein